MDGIFGRDNFRNEIIWHYNNSLKHRINHFSRLHDVILCYTKTENFIYKPQFDKNWNASTTQKHRLKKGFEIRKGELIIYDYDKFKKNGIVKESDYKKVRKNANASQPPIGNVWEIPIINPMSKERLGYPTQKPMALLDRIIEASCPEQWYSI